MTAVEEATEDTVEEQVQEVTPESIVEDLQQDVVGDAQEEGSERMVPLSVLQNERRKKQEARNDATYQQQQNMQLQQQLSQQEPEDDSAKYESATKEDLVNSQQEAVRIIDERNWIRNNPEKYETFNQDLKEFLTERPYYASSINSAPNRYEVGSTLMEKFAAAPQQPVKAPPVKKAAPNSPGSVPKSAALNAGVDVMSMNDVEYNTWRKAQRKRR